MDGMLDAMLSDAPIGVRIAWLFLGVCIVWWIYDCLTGKH